MNILRYAIIVIVLSNFITITHELGHFICAKIQKRKVCGFILGTGPIIFRKGIFELRLLPNGAMNQIEIDLGNQSIKYLKSNILLFGSGYIANIIIAIILYPISKFMLLMIIIVIIYDSIVTKESDGKLIIRFVKQIILVQKRSE